MGRIRRQTDEQKKLLHRGRAARYFFGIRADPRYQELIKQTRELNKQKKIMFNKIAQERKEQRRKAMVLHKQEKEAKRQECLEKKMIYKITSGSCCTGKEFAEKHNFKPHTVQHALRCLKKESTTEMNEEEFLKFVKTKIRGRKDYE